MAQLTSIFPLVRTMQHQTVGQLPPSPQNKMLSTSHFRPPCINKIVQVHKRCSSRSSSRSQSVHFCQINSITRSKEVARGNATGGSHVNTPHPTRALPFQFHQSSSSRLHLFYSSLRHLSLATARLELKSTARISPGRYQTVSLSYSD